MDINNKNELQTHQGMDSRHLQKVNCSDKKVLGEHSIRYKHCYDDRLTYKVYMYMILVVSIYAFLITMGLLTNHLQNKSDFFHIEKDTISP